MPLLSTISALFILAAPVQTEEIEIQPVDFRVQVYPYGGYYSYPPNCPPGYSYGPGIGYGQRGFSFYIGPGYPNYYRYPGCYWYGRPYSPRYYYYPRYRHHRRHHRR